MSDLVQFELEDGIALLTINRPKALNALNGAVLEALGAAVSRLEDEESVRCVVVTGAGSKSFVAGADIVAMSELSPSQALGFAQMGHRIFARLEALPVPVIAAVNGFCLGGGCELSLACDLVYASDNAKFGQPEVKLGLIPGFGGTQRLARRVGAMQALELVATGKMIGAAEAKNIGLCLDVYAPEELMGSVMKVAKTIASRAPVAVRIAKTVQAHGMEAPLAVANAFEQQAFANLSIRPMPVKE